MRIINAQWSSDCDERIPSLADTAHRDRGRNRRHLPAQAVGRPDTPLANGASTRGLWLRHRAGLPGGDGDTAWDHLSPMERDRHPSCCAGGSFGLPAIPER